MIAWGGRIRLGGEKAVAADAGVNSFTVKSGAVNNHFNS